MERQFPPMQSLDLRTEDMGAMLSGPEGPRWPAPRLPPLPPHLPQGSPPPSGPGSPSHSQGCLRQLRCFRSVQRWPSSSPSRLREAVAGSLAHLGEACCPAPGGRHLSACLQGARARVRAEPMQKDGESGSRAAERSGGRRLLPLPRAERLQSWRRQHQPPLPQFPPLQGPDGKGSRGSGLARTSIGPTTGFVAV